MKNKISVVIPIYKVERYLRQCLDSVLGQTYSDLDIILIDDGSPDKSGAICDEYAKNDPRIRVIHKQNAGVGAARNDGIRLALGEWLTFLDADDWWDLDFLEKMAAALPQEEIDLLFCAGAVYEYPAKTFIKWVRPEPFKGTKKEAAASMLGRVLAPRCGMGKQKECLDCVTVWGVLYKTNFLRQLPAFDERLHPGEEILFNLRAFGKAKTVAVCDCVGYHYRAAVATASTSRFNPRWPYMFDLLEKELSDFIADRQDAAELMDAFYVRMLLWVSTISYCYFFHKDNPSSRKQLAEEIGNFKKKPLVAAALQRRSNRYLEFRHILMKYAFRLPWIWPAELLFKGKSMLGHIRGA